MNKKQAIKSVSFLWIGSLLGSGSTFLIFIILARYLGVEQFGIFSSTLATITIFSLFAGFGVSQSWLKHFGKEGWGALRWLSPSFKLIIISINIILFVLFLWAFWGPHDNITKHILLIMSFFIVGQMIIELVSVKFQLEENYLKLSLWQLLPNLLRLILISILLVFLPNSLNVIDIALIYAFVSVLFIFVGLYQLIHMKDNLDLKGHGRKVLSFASAPKIKEVLSHSWAFGLASVFAFIYLQSDIIMVKYLAGNVQAGLYNVGFVIITAILIFPTTFYQKFLMPKVHRWANCDRKKFYENYRKGNIAMFLSGSIIFFLVYFLSSHFIPFLFGREYINSIGLVKILSLSLPFYFTAYNIGTTLVTNEHMKEKVKLMGLVGIVNIVLNLLLIPKYQAVGAAVATVISNMVLLLLYYSYAEKKVFISQKG